MPRHDHLKSGRYRVDAQLGNIVQDEDEYLSDLEHLSLWHSLGPRGAVVVATNRGNRGEGSKPFQNTSVPDVTSVNDQVASAQERHRLRPQQAMRVRDESYTWHKDGCIEFRPRSRARQKRCVRFAAEFDQPQAAVLRFHASDGGVIGPKAHDILAGVRCGDSYVDRNKVCEDDAVMG